MADKTGNTFDFKLLRRIMQYANVYKKTFYAVLIAAILLSFFATARPVILNFIIGDYIPNNNIEKFINYSSMMFLVLCLEVCFQFVFIFFANWLGQSIIRDIRIKLFHKMMHFKMQYFDNNAVGKLVTNSVSDIEKIAEIFSQGFFMIVGDVLKMLVVIIAMLFFDFKLSLYVFIVLPFILIATRLFQRAMKGAFKEVRKQVSALNTFVQERLSGMNIVQLFAREQAEYHKFKKINHLHKKAWIKTVWYNSIFFPIIELASSITVAIVLWNAGADAAYNYDTKYLGVIAMFIQMTQMLFRPLRQLADKFNTLQMGMVAANRVFEVLDTESKIIDEGTYVSEDIKGVIEFKNVRFSYIEGEEVLKGISFAVKPGETVAIVGATGAGKSTIINLLSRFYEIDSGEITLDGKNIKHYQLSNLRDKIAVVLQDVFLFAESIYNNITLNDDTIPLSTVKEGAKAIGVDAFIEELPEGYYYNVKERGTTLSSGQRQLLAFLRAYVSNPDILILDEATASIDSHSEQLIQKATAELTKGRTSIVIAHRLATIKKADKIIVMDQGKIVEQGTHQELLNLQEGYYKNLYEVQFAEA
ncbi:ABC transporter ATP-binding protein [Pseudofulvibacter geojedonensis]|uniref:ABC transporter ATP-binding protein n=1 Tax=Pseudofulvibacter geojedonensis TaxID=1123758 RepID=A0ABW3HZU9_9FLAO